MLQGIGLAFGEATFLFLLRDRKPVLEQPYARTGPHAFEFRYLAHELEVFICRAEIHHALNTRAVVPGPVEHNDLTRSRQVLDIALEIPLALFFFAWFLQCDDAGAAWIQVFHETLDRAALAGGIAPFGQHDDLLAAILYPFLDFQELDLKRRFLAFVDVAPHLGVIRVLAVLEQPPDGVGVMPHFRKVMPGFSRVFDRFIMRVAGRGRFFDSGFFCCGSRCTCGAVTRWPDSWFRFWLRPDRFRAGVDCLLIGCFFRHRTHLVRSAVSKRKSLS